MARVDADTDDGQELDLARAALAIARAHDLPELMTLARTAARALTGADGATLVLREGDQCRYADEDAIGPLWKGQRFPLTSCISGWTMLHDEAVLVDDIYADPRVPVEAYRSTFVQSLSMAPIGRGRPIGAIGCYWSRRRGGDGAVLRVQQVVADAVALAFELMEMRRRIRSAGVQAEPRSSRACRADAIHAAPAPGGIRQALREGEARYRLLVEQAPDGIFVADEAGRYVDVNEAGARMLGYTREEILARGIEDVVVPEEIPRIPLEVARFEGDAIVTSEWCLLRKDGTTFPGEVVGRRLPDGRLQGILRDLSERRNAGRALQESESFYRQTLESIPGMVFTMMPDGRCNYRNQQWEDYTGVPIEDGLRENLSAFLHPEDQARATDAWRNAVAARSTYDLECRIRRRDGAHEWFGVIARPIRDDVGGIVRWLGVAMNIEDRKRSEQQRIAAVTRQRDALVREVHHRIKNHLQGVIGLLRNATNGSLGTAHPLEHVIEQIRGVARVYGLLGRSPGADVTILELVETAAGGYPGQVLIEEGTPAAVAAAVIAGDDAVTLGVIINELIANAVKHRETGDQVAPVRVTLERNAGAVQIAIRNGPARLPPGFDFARGRGIGSGLELVAAMLPTRGAGLVIRQDRERVEARLTMGAPVLATP